MGFKCCSSEIPLVPQKLPVRRPSEVEGVLDERGSRRPSEPAERSPRLIALGRSEAGHTDRPVGWISLLVGRLSTERQSIQKGPGLRS